MNPRRPFADHVAVRDGRILGAGSLEELAGWGEWELDERLADKVVMPGMIEGHAHAMEGSVWQDVYVGPYDRRAPDGSIHGGCDSIEAAVARLRAAAEAPDAPETIMAWGFDPIYFDGPRMTRHDLDRVSTTKPVIVVHASFHIVNVNSLVLERAGITGATNVQGIVRDGNGEANGELQGMPARFLVMDAIGRDHFAEMTRETALWNFARSARNAGVTTSTDLANQCPDHAVENLLKVTGEDDYPLRIVPAFLGSAVPAEQGVARVRELVAKSTDKLRFGLVKLISDGSIQGFTARLKWPGYYNGQPNGLWYMDPDEIPKIIATYHAAGLQVHIHTNGDQATETVIDAIEMALRARPDADARFTLQHCQMAHEAHFRRMARLGISANLFANHIYYWGDQHYALTMGPERAERMNATGTALRLGVPFAIHSDAPITPLAPLFTAWCAVNRQTMSGRVLGASECLSVADALRAVTLGAAHTLKLDTELGSIETGKRADFAIFDDDPFDLGGAGLKDVRVWGTALGGRLFPCDGAA
ncbi:amidohydrolase [Oceanibacterium hippocampi]|nr:amidohydrolase [Oceanibacterium hippocampi]